MEDFGSGEHISSRILNIMAKKTIEDEILDDEEEEVPATPRVNRDFGREDLNDLRDAVNELHRG